MNQLIKKLKDLGLFVIEEKHWVSVNIKDNNPTWSDFYLSEKDGVFEVQYEIASSLCKAFFSKEESVIDLISNLVKIKK